MLSRGYNKNKPCHFLKIANFLFQSAIFSPLQDQTCSIYETRDIFKSLPCLLTLGTVYEGPTLGELPYAVVGRETNEICHLSLKHFKAKQRRREGNQIVQYR